MSETLVFDHVHLSAPNQAEAARWYVRHLGARPGASPERVLVGDRRWLIFYEAEMAKPSHLGAIDWIGFAVADAAAKVSELEGAGAATVAAPSEVPGFFKTRFVDDPYGARLAIVEHPSLSGFHYVHLRLPDPEVVFAWYLTMFGGEPTRINEHVEAIRYGDVWLLADSGAPAPSAGHAIDHVGWRTSNLDAKAAELKAKDVVFTMEPRQFNPSVRISFVEGPAGTRIEVLERV